MKLSLLNRITLILLYLCMALGVAFIVLLPRLLPQILNTDGLVPEATTGYMISLGCWMLGSIGGLFILFTLSRMMHSLKSDPFIRRNVRRLRDMGLTALGMTALTLIVAALYFRPMLLLVATAELLCALFSLALRGVFEKAVDYREENALTI